MNAALIHESDDVLSRALIANFRRLRQITTRVRNSVVAVATNPATEQAKAYERENLAELLKAHDFAPDLARASGTGAAATLISPATNPGIARYMMVARAKDSELLHRNQPRLSRYA